MSRSEPMPRASAALMVVAALAPLGCSFVDTAAEPSPRAQPERSPSPRAESRPRVRPARCPADVAGCVSVTGRVVYVEAVDPDGDGDAHYVLAGGDVTAPGLSAIDVAPRSRPRRLPGAGDLVSAAGPVRIGSYGQRQIEAVVVHHEKP